MTLKLPLPLSLSLSVSLSHGKLAVLMPWCQALEQVTDREAIFCAYYATHAYPRNLIWRNIKYLQLSRTDLIFFFPLLFSCVHLHHLSDLSLLLHPLFTLSLLTFQCLRCVFGL